MKTWIILKTFSLLIMMVGLVASCSPQAKDDTDIANETNDATFDERDNERDAEFLASTAAANYTEIHLAELANNRSNDEEIKRIANVLEKDHTKALAEVKSLAAKRGIALPLSETNDATEELSDLMDQKQEDFDKEWSNKLMDNHQKTISNFESQMDDTEDPELRNWVIATLPVLKEHREMLERYQEASNNM